MAQSSPIEWTDATWNPVRGCTRVGPECLRCYAERDMAKKSKNPKLPGFDRYAKFVQINPHGSARASSEPSWTGVVELVPYKLTEPLHWKKPRTIFVNSMSDLWHEKLPRSVQIEVYAVMAAAPWHTFQVLTKRPATRRMALLDPCFEQDVYAALRTRYSDQVSFRWPLPHVWEGVSIGLADKLWRARELKNTPAAVRFISYEPALESVDFTEVLQPWGISSRYSGPINLVIIGGESGPRARPFDCLWAMNLIDVGHATNTKIFVKQAGADPRASGAAIHGWPSGVTCDTCFTPTRINLKSRKGADPHEWPEWMRVRQLP